MAPLLNRLVLFWSDLRCPHEVLPCYFSRFAVTIWFIDSVERLAAREEEREEILPKKVCDEATASTSSSSSSSSLSSSTAASTATMTAATAAATVEEKEDEEKEDEEKEDEEEEDEEVKEQKNDSSGAAVAAAAVIGEEKTVIGLTTEETKSLYEPILHVSTIPCEGKSCVWFPSKLSEDLSDSFPTIICLELLPLSRRSHCAGSGRGRGSGSGSGFNDYTGRGKYVLRLLLTSKVFTVAANVHTKTSWNRKKGGKDAGQIIHY